MFARKLCDGNYYLCKSNRYKNGRLKKGAFIYDTFLVKSYCIGNGKISLPKELYGKRIRLKVEIVE